MILNIDKEFFVNLNEFSVNTSINNKVQNEI